MQASLTTAAKEALLQGFSDQKKNPFYTSKKGNRFARYDAIRIENNSFGCFTFFRYKGMDVMQIFTPYISFKDGSTLHLEGIKGKMRMVLE